MVTKKKSNSPDKSEIQLKKRKAGKVKQDYFGDIKLRMAEQVNRHPLDEMFPFDDPHPSDRVSSDIQENNFDALKNTNTGHSIDYSSDTQLENSGHSNLQTLDTQNKNFEHPDKIKSDTQDDFSGHSILEKLDTQPPTSVHPKLEKLSAEAPKEKSNAPRTGLILNTQTPGKEDSGHSKNKQWRKYDKSRSTVRVNLHISKEIDKKVRQYCLIDAEPKVELKEFYEQAAVRFLDFLDTQNIDSLSASTPLDDRRLKMLYKSKPSVINLYLAYNTIFNEFAGGKSNWKARWTPRDDEAGQKLNDADISLIELGIIQTQINKGIGQGRIQTFKYYMDEIENYLQAEISQETAKTILEVHRKMWKNQMGGRELDFSFLKKQK